MSDQHESETPVQEKNEPLVTISADGHHVSVSAAKGVPAWATIGLLETALVLVKGEYQTKTQEEIVE